MPPSTLEARRRGQRTTTEAFRRAGGTITVVFTGERSRRMLAAPREEPENPSATAPVDARDLGLEDRVLVLASNELGYAGCVVTPTDADLGGGGGSHDRSTTRCDTTDLSTRSRSPSTTRSTTATDHHHHHHHHDDARTARTNQGPGMDRLRAAVRIAVGFDQAAADYAIGRCGLSCGGRRVVPPVRAVRAAARTAIARLEKYGPIEASPDAGVREIVRTALRGLPYDEVRLHGDRPRRAPKDASPPAESKAAPASRVDSVHARAAIESAEPLGARNNPDELFKLARWFRERVGGRVVDYNTARSGDPVGTKPDGHRRRIVIAICPDGLAGAAVWHVANELVAMEGDVKRARRELRRAGLGGMIQEDMPPAYTPFDLQRHVGTAIRRALECPFQVDPNATDAELAALVMSDGAAKPRVRGTHPRAVPLVLREAGAANTSATLEKKPQGKKMTKKKPLEADVTKPTETQGAAAKRATSKTTAGGVTGKTNAKANTQTGTKPKPTAAKPRVASADVSVVLSRAGSRM